MAGNGGKWRRVAANIYFAGDRQRAKPYLWKQAIDGVAYREYFRSLSEAKAAQSAKLASVAKYGRLAHEFDKAKYSEYSEARKLIPESVSLIETARFWAKHHASAESVDITIDQAYDEFLEFKTGGRAKLKKRPLSKYHLADLKWRGRLLRAFFGHLRPADISPDDLLGMFADSGEAGRSVLNKHHAMRNFFNFCKARGYVAKNPYESISADQLPDKESGEKHPLTLSSVKSMLVFFEREWPQYVPWLALRLFAGIRTKEAERFKPEWIDTERRLIRIPGWQTGRQAGIPGTKTRDDWTLYDLPENLWDWLAAYPPTAYRESGNLKFPHIKIWPRIRNAMIAKGIIERFENNAFRDTFCTFLFSADPNPLKIAALMKHRNPNTMFESYLGSLRPKSEGLAYCQLRPELRKY